MPFTANTTFWYHDEEDGPQLVPAGKRFADDDPVMEGREMYFDPDTPVITKRGPGRPPKTATTE